MSVTQEEIVDAIGTLERSNVEEVGEHTRAGTGCGACRGEIRAALDARRKGSEMADAAATAR